jgi:hypothetical protein
MRAGESIHHEFIAITRIRLTWYGVLLMQTSKYGRSALTKSPMINSNFLCSGLVRSPISIKCSFNAKRHLICSLSQHTLLHFGCHSRVHLDGNDFPTSFEDPDGQITGSGTNFQHDIGRFQAGL